MRRLSEYPGGPAGLGLLLLRGSTVLLLVAVMLCVARAAPAAIVALGAAAAMVGLGLAARLFALLSALLCVLLATTCGVSVLLVIAQCLATLALALLGPGAFSIDAQLFGRRVIAR